MFHGLRILLYLHGPTSHCVNAYITVIIIQPGSSSLAPISHFSLRLQRALHIMLQLQGQVPRLLLRGVHVGAQATSASKGGWRTLRTGVDDDCGICSFLIWQPIVPHMYRAGILYPHACISHHHMHPHLSSGATTSPRGRKPLWAVLWRRGGPGAMEASRDVPEGGKWSRIGDGSRWRRRPSSGPRWVGQWLRSSKI